MYNLPSFYLIDVLSLIEINEIYCWHVFESGQMTTCTKGKCDTVRIFCHLYTVRVFTAG